MIDLLLEIDPQDTHQDTHLRLLLIMATLKTRKLDLTRSRVTTLIQPLLKDRHQLLKLQEKVKEKIKELFMHELEATNHVS